MGVLCEMELSYKWFFTLEHFAIYLYFANLRTTVANMGKKEGFIISLSVSDGLLPDNFLARYFEFEEIGITANHSLRILKKFCDTFDWKWKMYFVLKYQQSKSCLGHPNQN